MANGDTFDENKIYTVVMNSYRANGGGGHLTKGAQLSKTEIKKRTINCSDEDFRRILTTWLMQKEKYKAESLNNWELLPKEIVAEIQKKRG